MCKSLNYLHFNYILLKLKRTGVSCSLFTSRYVSYVNLTFPAISQKKKILRSGNFREKFTTSESQENWYLLVHKDSQAC